MIVSGYCDKQNKEYSVEIEEINASATEDTVQKNIMGRLYCKYNRTADCCTGKGDCSILKENGIRLI